MHGHVCEGEDHVNEIKIKWCPDKGEAYDKVARDHCEGHIRCREWL